MTYFVDGIAFWFDEFSILESLFFKEEADIISRFVKIIIQIMFSAVCIENCDFGWSYLKLFDKLINLLDSLLANTRLNEAWNDCKAIFEIVLNKFTHHGRDLMEKVKEL